jgi:hypothetical protein
VAFVDNSLLLLFEHLTVVESSTGEIDAFRAVPNCLCDVAFIAAALNERKIRQLLLLLLLLLLSSIGFVHSPLSTVVTRATA